MHNQQSVEPRQLRHRFAQLRLRHMLKLIHTRRHQKTLKPNHTRVQHRRKLIRISRHHATPKPNIYKAVVLGVLQLGIEPGERRSRRN